MTDILYRNSKNPLYFHHFQLQKSTGEYLNFMYLNINSKPARTVEQIQNDTDIASYIEFYTDDNSEEANITSLNVLDEFKGKGLAYYLLLKTIKYLNSVGILGVTLDDTTDKYRQQDNIYLILGFKYLCDYGPEMYGDMDILNKQSNYDRAKKYDWFIDF
jgi:GNAT superfamily N-acetyltransferase